MFLLHIISFHIQSFLFFSRIPMLLFEFFFMLCVNNFQMLACWNVL